MLKAGAQPVLAGQPANIAGLDAHVVEANVEFLKALGIAEACSTGSEIFLSAAGARYAQALVAGDKVMQQKILAECAGKALKPVTRFCEVAADMSFDRLFLQIKFLANVADEWGQQKDTAAQDRAGIYTAIAIMVEAGILEKRYLPV